MTLTSLALVQSLNLVEGTLAADAAATKSVTWNITENKTEQVSNPFLVVPNASNTSFTLTIPTNIIGRESLQPIPTEAGYTGSFTTKLEAGHSYKFSLSLRAPKIAGSNIYFNGTDLTFDLHGNKENQGYQGVYFRFGSLMGISGILVTGGFATTTAVYIPGTGETSGYAWANIPHTSSGSIGADDPVALTGDICRYLGTIDSNLDGYRLPTWNEFGTAAANVTVGWDATNPTTVPVNGGWVGGFTTTGWPTMNNTKGVANGKSDLIKLGYGYIKNLTMDEACIPCSGWRRDTNGELNLVCQGGYAWSGSVASNGEGALFNYGSTGMMLGRPLPRTYGFPVRCVKND
jgi:hypothetical protein